MFTFFCVSLCWVLFQPDLSKALAMFEKLFYIQPGMTLTLSNQSLWYTVVFLFACQWLVRSGWWDDDLPPVAGPGSGRGLRGVPVRRAGARPGQRHHVHLLPVLKP